METIKEMIERQDKEVRELLEKHQEIWNILLDRYSNEVPLEVAQTFKDIASRELFENEQRQLKEREATPVYGEVLAYESKLREATQSAYIDVQAWTESRDKQLENGAEMDDMQDELERLLKEARERERILTP